MGTNPQEDGRPVSSSAPLDCRLRELDVRDNVGEIEMEASRRDKSSAGTESERPV